jgi:hypothetical protein
MIKKQLLEKINRLEKEVRILTYNEDFMEVAKLQFVYRMERDLYRAIWFGTSQKK